MWHTELSRRELLELCLGGYDPQRIRARLVGQVAPHSLSENFDAYWQEDPSQTPGLPNLIVTPKGEAEQFLVAVTASPQAPMPFTALCRVLDREEAAQWFSEPSTPPNETLLRATAVLAIVEAILHSDGRFNLKSIGPAVCRRSLAFAWGRAAAAGAPRSSFEPLVTRWLEVYASMGHAQSTVSAISATVDAIVNILALTLSEDAVSVEASHRSEVVSAVLFGSELALSRAWRNLADPLGLSVSLDEIAAASREDRAGFLLQAMRVVGKGQPNRTAVVGCAFLATQVAPRSLEHLEILRASGNPELVLWYAFLAAIQHPVPILSSQGGLGFRMLRDIKEGGELLSPPTADLSFPELRVISKLGWDGIARRCGHAGEVEVELIPRVGATFALPPRSTRAESADRGTSESPRRNGLTDEQRAKIYAALNAIAHVVEDTPEQLSLVSPQAPVKKSYRKKAP